MNKELRKLIEKNTKCQCIMCDGEQRLFDDEIDELTDKIDKYIHKDKKAVCCPVCNGNGIVSNGFYNQTTGDWTTSSTEPETCRSCHGSGYLVI